MNRSTLSNAVMLAMASLLHGCATHVGMEPVPAAVPEALRAPADQRLAMIVPARGVQIYECRATKERPGHFDWAFVAPQAELYDTAGARIGTHYAGPHWEAADGSKIVGTVRARADAPTSGTIPWLLLEARSVGRGGAFAAVASVQRVNTSGGAVPVNGCAPTRSGVQVQVPYTADYYFFVPR